MMGRNDEDWAVFWCSLLSPVLLGEIPERQRERYFQELSREERRLPNGQRRRALGAHAAPPVAAAEGRGRAGLVSPAAFAIGESRGRSTPTLLARAVELKKEQPRRSDKVINRILKREFGRSVPRSTLYRHLRREGATRRKLGVSTEKVRCRWTRDQPGALWVGDFEHGPLVMHQGESVQDPSLGLDRLPQPLHRRGPLLPPREPGHPRAIRCCGPGATTAPAANCTWTTPRSTTPRPCNWPARN